MSDLNKKLEDIYNTFKDHENSPVPCDIIKEFLELDGFIAGKCLKMEGD